MGGGRIVVRKPLGAPPLRARGAGVAAADAEPDTEAPRGSGGGLPPYLQRVGRIVGAAIASAGDRDRVRAIVGDYVRSDRLRGLRYETLSQSGQARGGRIDIITDVIVVEHLGESQGEGPAPLLRSLIVNRRLRFELKSGVRGRLDSRGDARLSGAVDPQAAVSSLMRQGATQFRMQDPQLLFDAPFSAGVPLQAQLPPAARHFDAWLGGHVLLNPKAGTAQQLQAIERLIPGFTDVPRVASRDQTPAQARQSPRPRRVDEDVDVPEPAAAGRVPSTVLEPQRSGAQDAQVDVERDDDTQQDDPWYAGLLRALGALLLGLAVLAGAALVVAAVAAVVFGVALSATAAVLIAGALLLTYGLVRALIARSGQDAYQGRPGATLGRALLDAVGVTGVQEAWSGEDVATGRKLTPGERVERGVSGGVAILGTLLGARGLLKGPRTAPPGGGGLWGRYTGGLQRFRDWLGRRGAGTSAPEPAPAPPAADPLPPSGGQRTPASGADDGGSLMPEYLRMREELVGDYYVSGSHGLIGKVYLWRILILQRRGGPSGNIAPLLRFFAELEARARAAGASELRVQGLSVQNANVMKMDRIITALGGRIESAGGGSITIVKPLQ